MRIWTFHALAYTALANSMIATNFSGLVVRLAISHSSCTLRSAIVSFAFALLPIKAIIAGAYTANQSTVPSAIFRSWRVSLHFHSKTCEKEKRLNNVYAHYVNVTISMRRFNYNRLYRMSWPFARTIACNAQIDRQTFVYTPGFNVHTCLPFVGILWTFDRLQSRKK